MKRTRRRDTSAEMEIRRRLHAAGLRYFVDRPVIPGDQRRRADIVFPRKKIAIFIDGCFWHGCPEHATWPKSNADWWREKIEANRARDLDTNERLETAGWTVLRCWEHESPETTVERVFEVLGLERDEPRGEHESDRRTIGHPPQKTS
jgi:DNA mismatch endonuclease (patch repair protein)